MSIIFFRFFLLFSVVANRVGPKTRYHRAYSRSLTSLVLLCSLRFAAKILYEIMLDRIFCNFSFFFTQFFWLMGWIWELFWGFLRFQLLFSRIFSGFWGWVWELFCEFLRFQLLFSGFFSAFGVRFGSCFVDFCGFSYFFLGFFRLMGWVWELFWGFLRFQLLFSGFFSAFGLILGAVLKVLWITAPQGPAYYAINLWLLYIMLI